MNIKCRQNDWTQGGMFSSLYNQKAKETAKGTIMLYFQAARFTLWYCIFCYSNKIRQNLYILKNITSVSSFIGCCFMDLGCLSSVTWPRVAQHMDVCENRCRWQSGAAWRKNLIPQLGNEPGTSWLSFKCSTYWATGESMIFPPNN